MKLLTKPLVSQRLILWRAALCAAMMLSGGVALANNILLNPSFENSAGAWPPVAPVDWTYYGPGENYYIEPTGPTEGPAHTGGRFYKIWGTVWDVGTANWTGVYQDKTCGAGWTYAADGWFRTRTGDTMGADNRAWVEVSFRDSGGTVLALYKTDEFGSAAYAVDTWHHLLVTNVCDIGNNNAVTGSVAQLVAPAGTAVVRYQFVHYQINNNGGACQFDDAMLDQLVGPVPPVISNLLPGDMLLANAANGITFTVSSPSATPINNTGIQLTVNGSNVSSGLVITDAGANKNVSYTGLIPNQAYTASITVLDTQNLSITRNFAFDTMAPILVWEAEDYDFNGGQFLDNPELATAPGNPNSYFGQVGTEEVDFHETSGDGDHFYRASDRFATTYANDASRAKFGTAYTDYKVGWFNGGEWMNFTRTFPAGSYTVVARLAGDGASTATLSKVEGGTPTELGIFNSIGRGWNTYDYIPLQDSLGNTVTVTLGGVQTLRFTTAGNVDPNFIMLIPAQTGVPLLLGMYPNGANPFQYTNKFVFTVASPGSSIQPSGIKLILDGVDVSSGLTISGTETQTVTYAALKPNAPHTVTLTVTNTAGGGFSRSFSFDTFTQANFMVDAEDYDYDAGQFLDNPAPGAYAGLYGTAEIDFHHTTTADETFAGRVGGLPTERAGDFLRDAFVTAGASDYNLGWFNDGEWGNYTRTYPAGSYLVYGRFAGSGAYSVYLDKVTSGAGTVNQTTQRLGRFGANGRGWQTFDWVPLRDMDLAAPVTVQLNGKATLRIATAGNCNPNYFMLVPFSGITISAAKSGNNVVISFPTQAGVNYQVLYSSSLTGATWTELTTVAGDGSVKTATDPVGAGPRFYKVVAP